MSATGDSIDAMEAILTKIKDIHNSQAALNQKLAVAQMALEDTPDEELKAVLEEAYSNANKNAELIQKATKKYEMHLNALKMES